MWTLLVLLVPLLSQEVASNTNVNPVIPKTVDATFVEFQKALNTKQTQLVPALYNTLASFQTGFDQFKNQGEVAVGSSTQVDPDFVQFQKFIKRYSRVYNNMQEFMIRFGLISEVLSKSKGYNIGGDLVGINHLSDKTLSEKRAFYG